MPSNRRGRERSEARRPAFREVKRRLLVVCEGMLTEPQYISGLAGYLRNAILQITIPPEQGDPRRLIELAKLYNHKAEQDARRSRDANLRFEEVWCVFDKDDHERFNDACQMAEDNGFNLAVSCPSFELWLLLHHRASPGPQHRDDVYEMLRREIPGYNKAVDFRMFAGGLDDAGDRAKRIDDHAREDGEARYVNPSTSMFRLVASMLKELKDKEPFERWGWLQQTLAESEE